MNTTIRKPKTGSTTFSDPQKFINRELSWLNFNARVLEEAARPGKPLLDRLKFIAIFSSNLDEFFMVRVAGLCKLVQAGVQKRDPAGYTPAEQLTLIRKKISGLLKKQYQLLREILAEFEQKQLKISAFADLSEKKQQKLRKFFTGNILPALTPLAIDRNKPFPLINPGTLQLAISFNLRKSGRKMTASVEVPEFLDRFIPVPGGGKEKNFILLEDLISENISMLFPGCSIKAKQVFRVTRDMDYHIDPDESEDLLHAMLDKLSRRTSRAPVRVEFSSRISNNSLQKFLAKSLELTDDLCYSLPGALNLKQFTALLPPDTLPGTEELPWPPVTPEIFNHSDNVFEAIDKAKNILLIHPYHSFDPLLRMLEEAANDPDVLAIKQTLYRVSGNSPVVKALQKAAENGKQVTAVVELKARFDESNNIAWAELLDLSGAHVVYSEAELKIHCKTLLIIRRENGRLRRYVHFGTGNYNDRTAKQYSDLSLLSNDQKLADDAAKLFNLLSGKTEPPEKWEAIYVSPFDLRRKLSALIEKETALGPKGRIIAKMNSFSDPELIRQIHSAAAAGVKIDLIVRGICCLRPPENCKNLRIISIIDRYLEHARIFCFGAEKRLYCASADWMPRNLDRRIEVMFPVTDRQIAGNIMQILEFQINDRQQGWLLNNSGNYVKDETADTKTSRSQRKIYDMVCQFQKINDFSPENK